jgi:hypothetical protein
MGSATVSVGTRWRPAEGLFRAWIPAPVPRLDTLDAGVSDDLTTIGEIPSCLSLPPSVNLRQGDPGILAAMKTVMDNNFNKASVSLLAMAALVIAAIAAKVRATVDAQAPVGYEDETGFHFGTGAGE